MLQEKAKGLRELIPHMRYIYRIYRILQKKFSKSVGFYSQMNWSVMPNNDLTIQYVVLGPDEKDVNEYFFLS